MLLWGIPSQIIITPALETLHTLDLGVREAPEQPGQRWSVLSALEGPGFADAVGFEGFWVHGAYGLRVSPARGSGVQGFRV